MIEVERKIWGFVKETMRGLLTYCCENPIVTNSLIDRKLVIVFLVSVKKEAKKFDQNYFSVQL